jgi:hypothetical protein
MVCSSCSAGAFKRLIHQSKEQQMKGKVIVLVSSLIILTACVVAPRQGGGLTIIPILPAIVEVDADNYYAYGGYHYFYTNERWYYSDSRNGRRSELPRSHWARETHQRGWDRAR